MSDSSYYSFHADLGGSGCIILYYSWRPLIIDSGAGPAISHGESRLYFFVALYPSRDDYSAIEIFSLSKKTRHHRWFARDRRIALPLQPSLHQITNLPGGSDFVAVIFRFVATLADSVGVLKQNKSRAKPSQCRCRLRVAWTDLVSFLYFGFLAFPQRIQFRRCSPPAEHEINPLLIYFSLTTLRCRYVYILRDSQPAMRQFSEGMAGPFYWRFWLHACGNAIANPRGQSGT